MAVKQPKVIKGSTARLTLLDECGVPVIGATSTVVSKGFIKADPSFNYKDGTKFEAVNAWGDLCVNEEDDPTLESIGWDLDFCMVDLALFSMVTAFRELTSGGATIGIAANFEPNSAGFALELWAKLAGQACTGGDPEWAYFLSPQMGKGKLKNFSLGNSTATFGWTAKSGTVPVAWGEGPYETTALPAGVTIAAGEPWVMGVTTEPPPAPTVGAVALAALAP